MSTPFTETWLEGLSSTAFYTRTYAASTPVAALVYLHGLAEHCGRYQGTHSLFAQRGVTVFTYDQRGYGKTAQDLEHKSPTSTYGKTNWKEALDDLEWAIQHAHTTFPGLPLFVMGFSTGGTLTLSMAMSPFHKATISLLAGIIAFAPTVHLTHQPPKAAQWVIKQLNRVMPNTLVPVKHNTEHLSRNPETNKAYMTDPLIGPPGCLRMIGDLVTQGDRLLAESYREYPENTPIIFLQGLVDQVSLPKSTELLYDCLPAKDKKLVTYPDACHELHNEPDGVKEKMFEDSMTFIESHLSSASTA